MFPCDDRDTAFGHAEDLRKHFNKLGIGGSLDGRGLEPDEKRTSARPRDARIAGSRNDTDSQLNARQGA
jgi:hypothetical protein